MGPNVDVVSGIHLASTVDVLGWDGRENEQDKTIHEHGRQRVQQTDQAPTHGREEVRPQASSQISY